MFRGRYIRLNQLDCVKPSFYTKEITPKSRSILVCCRYNTTCTETLEKSLQAKDFDNAWSCFNQLLSSGKDNQIDTRQYSRLLRLVMSNPSLISNEKAKGQKILNCMQKNQVHFTSCAEYAPLILFQAKNGRIGLTKQTLAEMKAQNIEPDIFIYNQWIKGSTTQNLASGLEVLKEMKACGVRPESSTFNILLKSAQAKNDIRMVTKIKDTMDSMDIQKSILEYNTLIDRHSKLRKVTNAEEIYEEMIRANISPDSSTYNIMIRMYGRKMNAEKVISMYSLMKEKKFSLSPSSYDYVTVSLAELSKFDEALEMLREVKQLGLELTGDSYDFVIHELLKHSRPTEAFELYQQVLKSSLSVKTFTKLIHFKLRQGNVKMATEIYQDMVQQGITPDSRVISVLVEGQNKRSRGNQIGILWEEIKKHRIQMDDYLSNLMLGSCIETSSPNLAIQVFEEANRQGNRLDLNIYRNLIRLYLKVNRYDAIKTILRNLSTPPTIDAKALPKPKLDLKFYTILIRQFTERFDLDGVRIVHSLIQGSGVQLDSVAYNTLLNGYSKCGDFEEAKRIFTRYLEEGVQLDTVSFNIMIRGYTIRKMLTQAMSLLEEMDKSGISPNTLTFNTLIDGYIKCGDQVQAEYLAQAMEKRGIPKSSVTFNELILGYMSESNIEAAKDCYKKMIQLGVQPDVSTFDTLIHGYVNHARFTEANLCFDEMRQSGVQPTIETFNTLMSGYLKAYRIDDALKVYDQLSSLPPDHNVSPTVVTYSILMNCWGFSGKLENVLAVWSKLKELPNFTELDLAGSISVLLDSCGMNNDINELEKRWLEVNALEVHLSENNHASYWEALLRCDMAEKAVVGLETWCRDNGTVSRKTSEIMLKLVEDEMLAKRIEHCLKNRR